VRALTGAIRGDCQLEIWGVEAEKKAFEKIFEKQLVIERIQTD